MPLTAIEERLRAALEADASRAVGCDPDAPPITALARGRQRSRWTRRPIVAVAALASGTAAIVLLAIVLVVGPGSPASAVAATPPMLVFDRAGAPPVEALLASLAARAARLAPVEQSNTGYVYEVLQSWNLAVAVSGSTASASVIPTVTQTWSSSAGPLLSIETPAAPLAPRPLSRAEEARTLHGATVGRPYTQHLRPSELRPFATLSRLSGNPRRLFHQLADPGGFGWVSKLTSPIAVGHATLSLTNYLGYSPATPAFLRTLYRMLALVPGVSDAGWVTDRAGRRGIAIAVPTGGKGHWHSFRVIADPSSGRLLGVEDIQLQRSPVPIKPPFVFAYDLYLHASRVRQLGARS
jgi:hypothetical protein